MGRPAFRSVGTLNVAARRSNAEISYLIQLWLCYAILRAPNNRFRRIDGSPALSDPNGCPGVAIHRGLVNPKTSTAENCKTLRQFHTEQRRANMHHWRAVQMLLILKSAAVPRFFDFSMNHHLKPGSQFICSGSEPQDQSTSLPITNLLFTFLRNLPPNDAKTRSSDV